MNNVLRQFSMKGEPVYCERYGSGHINKTYDIKTTEGKRYILQRINDSIFKNVDVLMNNIVLVTEHLKKVAPKEQKILSLINTKNGGSYYKDEYGNFWRMWKFIGKSVCLNRPESLEDFYQSALAFGNFSKQLSNFDASLLSETIPDFHNTPMRYTQLHAAIAANKSGRAKDVQAEIDFALARENDAHAMVDMARKGELPLRVTHNDTKLNNVMLDKKTRKPLCVIDLDCVMPGLLGNDFGDSIRFGASTAEEDEQDLQRVHLDLDYFEAYTKGFLEACANSMTQEEIDTLPTAAKLMTLECGIRFLADHINGDIYFSTSRSGHNLDRARTQFQLVKEMEEQHEAMLAIVHKYAKKYRK